MQTVSPVQETRHYTRIVVIVLVSLFVIPVAVFGYFILQEFLVRAEDLIPQQVTAERVTKSSAVLSWHTPHETQSIVEYGTSPESLTSYAPEAEKTSDHRVELTLLSSSTSYYYQIRTGDEVYSDGGVPWSFVTRSQSGEDVTAQVKGLSTRVANGRSIRPTRTPTPEVCDVTECDAIRAKLGHGCTTKDFVKCIATTPAKSPTVVSTTSHPTTAVMPTESTPDITSSRCKPSYLYADASSTNKCTRWVWERLDSTGKPVSCREAFDHYELECKSNSFQPTPGATMAPEQQYFNGSITDITRNSTGLDVIPEKGYYVFCHVRAVDPEGHASDWFDGSAKCE